MSRPINLEDLGSATDEQLAVAYVKAVGLAHDAPKDTGAMTWATRAREACRIGGEIARRSR